MDDIILYLLEYLLLKPVGTLGYSMSAVRIACRRRRLHWISLDIDETANTDVPFLIECKIITILLCSSEDLNFTVLHRQW